MGPVFILVYLEATWGSSRLLWTYTGVTVSRNLKITQMWCCAIAVGPPWRHEVLSLTGRTKVLLQSFSQVIQEIIYHRIAGSNSYPGTMSSLLLWRRRYATCCFLHWEATGGQGAVKRTESIWTGCLLVKHFSSIWRTFPVSNQSRAFSSAKMLMPSLWAEVRTQSHARCSDLHSVGCNIISHGLDHIGDGKKKKTKNEPSNNVNLIASTNIFFLILKSFANSWSMLWNLCAFFSIKSTWEYFYEQKHYEIYPHSYAIFHFTKNWVSSPENFLWHFLKPVQQNLQRHENKKD